MVQGQARTPHASQLLAAAEVEQRNLPSAINALPVHSVHLEPTPHARWFLCRYYLTSRAREWYYFSFPPALCSPVVTVGNYMSLGRSVDSRWWWVYDLAIEGEFGALSSWGLRKNANSGPYYLWSAPECSVLTSFAPWMHLGASVSCCQAGSQVSGNKASMCTI